jgi:hypothetical protein
MNNLKIRAALFTVQVFTIFATIIALLMLARAYQGTDELKYAALAACSAWIGYVIYKIKLDDLEETDAKVKEVIDNIRNRVDCQ